MALNSSYCHDWPDNVNNCNIVRIARLCAASLSLLGCVFVIFIIVLFKKYRFFSQRLVLWLSVAALMDTIAYIIGEPHQVKNGACIFEGFWMMLFDWSVLLWVSCITFNLFWNVVKRHQTNKLEGVYHVISWGIAFVIACLPLSDGIVYGPAGLWCWIHYGENAWRFGIWYIPLFILIGIMIITYTYVIFVINKRTTTWGGTMGAHTVEEERSMVQLKQDVKQLRLYPLAYFVANLFPLVNRIQNAASSGTHDNPIFTLALLHALTAPLQGLLNAVAYAFDKETRSKLTWMHIKSAVMQLCKQSVVKEYPLLDEREGLVRHDDSDG
ncbi:cyclic AMP receptor-like protein A [Corticium candelabrum]|uniref:cyclic AMP receptor-like protein A n=1 Tax=Corticium candelabrum TaxID=121492 RepID=UPI002E25EC38|nr:cyclic AMP receptor-like protein A [Corticium candelabrum]